MEIQTVLMIFGFGLAALAVIVTIVGMRSESFPSRGALFGILGFAVLMVAGTTTYAVKEAQHEQHEREHGEIAEGEEASVPVVVPARS
ncbi:MAG: hypothetical protein ACSLFD_11330 [Solirubrobacterales bacterium]